MFDWRKFKVSGNKKGVLGLPLLQRKWWSRQLQCRQGTRRTYLLTYLLTPWSRVLEKLSGPHLVKKFLAFYGTRMFITAFTSARHYTLWLFRNMIRFYGEQLLTPRIITQTGGTPLVGCPRLLIQYIRSYPPYWRPFLHPQPEDAPFRGDRDPVITEGTGLGLLNI
jgi:hypothetical protein